MKRQHRIAKTISVICSASILLVLVAGCGKAKDSTVETLTPTATVEETTLAEESTETTAAETVAETEVVTEVETATVEVAVEDDSVGYVGILLGKHLSDYMTEDFEGEVLYFNVIGTGSNSDDTEDIEFGDTGSNGDTTEDIGFGGTGTEVSERPTKDETETEVETETVEENLGYHGKMILFVDKDMADTLDAEVGNYYKLQVSPYMTMSIPPQANLVSLEAGTAEDEEYYLSMKEKYSNYPSCSENYVSGLLTDEEIISDAINNYTYWTDEQIEAFRAWFGDEHSDYKEFDRLWLIMTTEDEIESLKEDSGETSVVSGTPVLSVEEAEEMSETATEETETE